MLQNKTILSESLIHKSQGSVALGNLNHRLHRQDTSAFGLVWLSRARLAGGRPRPPLSPVLCMCANRETIKMMSAKMKSCTTVKGGREGGREGGGGERERERETETERDREGCSLSSLEMIRQNGMECKFRNGERRKEAIHPRRKTKSTPPFLS